VPAADAPALAASLREEFGLPETSVRNQAQIKAFSLEIFENTFRVTGRFERPDPRCRVAGAADEPPDPVVPPPAAGGAGLGAGHLARAAGPDGGLAPLLLALLTFVLAVPVGLGLAWVLLAVVNVEAFGWRLPMRVFPGEALRLLILALIAAGIAAAIPALRLWRMAPARMLQVFSQER
jgi:putative ABC transport system permease protein